MSEIEVSPDGRSSIVRYGGSPMPDLDKHLTRALALMGGDPKKASQLFARWAETDTEMASLIPDVLSDYIERRLKRIKKGAK